MFYFQTLRGMMKIIGVLSSKVITFTYSFKHSPCKASAFSFPPMFNNRLDLLADKAPATQSINNTLGAQQRCPGNKSRRLWFSFPLETLSFA